MLSRIGGLARAGGFGRLIAWGRSLVAGVNGAEKERGDRKRLTSLGSPPSFLVHSKHFRKFLFG